MRAAEEEARSRSCLGVFLDTYSFQARPFYEKLGYEQFGTLEAVLDNAHSVSGAKRKQNLLEGRERIIDGRVDTALERVYRQLTGNHA